LILVDSNIPMYLVGAPHPHKADAQRLLENLITDRERLVTDAEVLQEILHRYVAINRRDAIQPAFDALLGIADDVLAVDRVTAERAKEIVMGRQMSARDAVHLAVMERHGIERILSFDSGLTASPELPASPDVQGRGTCAPGVVFTPASSRLACHAAARSGTGPRKSSRFDHASPPSADPAHPEIPTRVPIPE
jgi:uncharacterized protein